MTEITDEMHKVACAACWGSGKANVPGMWDAIAAVAPLIAAQERERIARMVEECFDIETAAAIRRMRDA